MAISLSLGTLGNRRPFRFHFESIDRTACSEMCCTSESLSLRISVAKYVDSENFYLLALLEAYASSLLKTVNDYIVPQFLQISV
jgi:hypothetical protein